MPTDPQSSVSVGGGTAQQQSAPLATGSAGQRVPDLPELREISDARTLRALTHPVRIALIELLTLYGPMTATQAGERIGESATTCSFHLRQLEKYGFVEEAGGGKGRARPWRMSRIGLSIRSNDDAETELAAAALTQLWRDRMLGRYRTWIESRGSYPRRWRRAAGDMEHVIYLTADELEELRNDLAALLLPRTRERLIDPSKRPPGAVPVEVLTFCYPLELPTEAPETPPASRS